MSISTNLGWDVPDDGADDDTWGVLLRAILASQDAMFAGGTSATTIPNTIQNYISGLTLSAAGGSATFGIATGAGMDSTNAALMRLASAYTKTTSAWAVGSATGALDTGAIANNTWYHVWLIQRSDTKVVDVLVSTSATAPTMPANYDRKRRIGAMRTDGSAQWKKFIQLGDEFRWDAPANDIATTTLGTSASVTALSYVPSGVSVNAHVSGYMSNAGAGQIALVSSPLTSDRAPNAVAGDLTVSNPVAGQGNSYTTSVLTNTSAQVRARSDAANTTFGLTVQGWTDPRGQW